jgi:hypothetical protein
MRRSVLSLIIIIGGCAEASAHYLWIVAKPEGQSKAVEVCFSESASPDDPELLKKFSDLKVIAVSRGRDGVKRQEVPLTPNDASLTGTLPEGMSAPLTAQKTYGVVSRGGETFLLKYFAKTYPGVLPGSWTAVNDLETAALEITPKLIGTELALEVTWQGKPAAGDQVTIEGPGLEEKLQGNTDEQGVFRCRLPASGLVSIRARHQEMVPGTFGGKKYDSIRHYATLALQYSVPTVVAVNRALPPLPKGVTSFGAAVAGDAAYVYGGHFGDAHHYSSEGQSNEFWRLLLKSGRSSWESLPSGPNLTGLAMVSHEGKLYRLGGFTAKNSEQEEQDLWSQDGFAMFDPSTGKWTDLIPLPEPRSSHDAAMLQGKLYIVGGWNMAGRGNTRWHDTAWACDLEQTNLTWTPLPKPPFHRRALSLAAHDGKLYVLGGMQESGKPTTQVDIYDPSSHSWSVGPSLIGGGMEGFGNASFPWDGRLVATTISGSVQQLSDDGKRWNIIGQLAQPRFFHRQLVTPSGELLILGGASMQTGKTNSVEVWTRELK